MILLLTGLDDFAGVLVHEALADVAGSAGQAEGEAGAAVGGGKLHGLVADVDGVARQEEGEPPEGCGGEPGKVADVGVLGDGHEVDGNGGGSDCGGDLIKQFPTAFGLPLFLFWPRGTALTWEVTSSLPSL